MAVSFVVINWYQKVVFSKNSRLKLASVASTGNQEKFMKYSIIIPTTAHTKFIKFTH